MRRPDVDTGRRYNDVERIGGIHPSPLLDGKLCSCGHVVRRHWNDGGCAVPIPKSRGGLCPCSLTRIECQFHVVRLALLTDEKIYVRSAQHLRRFLSTPQFVPRDVRWTVRPWSESSVIVVFTSWFDAIEFATRDWLNPLDVGVSTRDDTSLTTGTTGGE